MALTPLDFPASPTTGQIHPNPAVSGQPQYTYDGEKWSGGAGVGNVYMSDFPPAAPVGSLWFETDTGILYVNYNDGSSIQWVAKQRCAASASALTPAGSLGRPGTCTSDAEIAVVVPPCR